MNNLVLQGERLKVVGELKTEMFRTYGILELVVEIPACHMNVTAKNNALISETAYLKRYTLPFAFRQRTER